MRLLKIAIYRSIWTYQEMYLLQEEAYLAQIAYFKNLKKAFIIIQKGPYPQKEVKLVEIIIKGIKLAHRKSIWLKISELRNNRCLERK